MKFTLKNYQEGAVKDVLEQLQKARKRVWHEDGDKHAFSLTATTGAGKTVMAASVFESLFFGNDDLNFEPDSGAVVIWFSDDPSLNEQSRWRLFEASDKLTVSNLVTVDNTFRADQFQPGKIYFLNTQKLSKTSLLVRGYNPDDPGIESKNQTTLMPDSRQYPIWDVIRNTIEDPDLTLYLVLDEAHRGMKEESNSNIDSKPTIVKQLINGTNGSTGIPVVWGISATVARFNEAMAGMQGRSTLPNIVVDPKKVQESGLLKDTINLDVPDGSGEFSTVLLRRATSKLKEISKEWENYSRDQKDLHKVLPLMVLQVPNSPDHNTLGTWLDTIFEEWPQLPRDSVANVFGEHKKEIFGSHTVPYIAPERVEDSHWVRILVAKDAISTGWDCPRAEVMISFRKATDKTHITQLLGRMVRTPLARRIPGNERLNAVDCILPKFDKRSVAAVVSELMTGESGEELPNRRILINPREFVPNPYIPEEVWKKYSSLTSQTIPKRQSRPVKRLTALAHELAVDGILEDAGKMAHAEMHKVLDEARLQYDEEVKQSRGSVLTVIGKTGISDLSTQEMTFNDFVEQADYEVIEEAFRFAGRSLSTDLAISYSEHLANTEFASIDMEDALIEAHTAVAAMGLVKSITDSVEETAELLTVNWLRKYSVQIKDLSDLRQEAYREIREMSAEPLDVDLARPHIWLQMTSARRQDGKEESLSSYKKHLLCDEEGLFPLEHNTWEEKVIIKELERDDNIAWYRNPARASQDSLGITYQDAGEIKILRPDFIFFSKLSNGAIVADIVDPHGTQFSDALPKAKGFAVLVEAHPDVFRRVELCAEVDGTFKCIDLANDGARKLVMSADHMLDVYKSDYAKIYN